MLIYLDLCALKRPFDEQGQPRVAEETRAVFGILARVEGGLDVLAWSRALDFENEADPDGEVRDTVRALAGLTGPRVSFDARVEQRVLELTSRGFAPLDAAHLASAEAAGCRFLVTCDDRFLRLGRRLGGSVKVVGPVEYLAEVGDDSSPK